MYEPLWFSSKALSAIAEGLAGVLAVIGVAGGKADPLRVGTAVTFRSGEDSHRP